MADNENRKTGVRKCVMLCFANASKYRAWETRLRMTKKTLLGGVLRLASCTPAVDLLTFIMI